MLLIFHPAQWITGVLGQSMQALWSEDLQEVLDAALFEPAQWQVNIISHNKWWGWDGRASDMVIVSEFFVFPLHSGIRQIGTLRTC